MKKQLIAIGLASVLTAPSVALADASIYGTFRTGLEFTSGTGASDAAVGSFYSRFGLKGSSEVSEGLTASFQLEEDYDSSTAKTAEQGRIGRVALSGGFGTLALGNFWTASHKHFGAVDPTMNYGVGGGKTGRAAKMVSYSSSVGAVSFQIDRYTDVVTKAATVEFGASASAGPVNVGFGYWSKEAAAATVLPTTVVTHKIYSADSKDPKKASTTQIGTRTVKTNKNGTEPETVSEQTATDPKKDKSSAADLAKGIEGEGVVTSEDISLSNPKTSFTGFYVSSSLGGMNLTVGLGSVDNGVPNEKQVADAKTKVTPKDVVDESQTDVSIIALSGSVGDSGVSYAVQISDSDKVLMKNMLGETTTTVSDPSKTVLNLTSALGGGASLVFEHASLKSGADTSLVALKVDF